MEELKNRIHNFYNTIFERYKDRNYAMAITAMHFHVCYNDLEAMGI